MFLIAILVSFVKVKRMQAEMKHILFFAINAYSIIHYIIFISFESNIPLNDFSLKNYNLIRLQSTDWSLVAKRSMNARSINLLNS